MESKVIWEGDHTESSRMQSVLEDAIRKATGAGPSNTFQAVLAGGRTKIELTISDNMQKVVGSKPSASNSFAISQSIDDINNCGL